MSAGVRPTVASFVAPGPLAVGRVALDEDAAHHARVRRLEDGAPVTVRDGAGAVASGRILRVAKRALDVELDAVAHVPRPAPVHLLAPVGDRERMLWLAEKAVEIGIASWRAVRWQRSRSVSPRGEGDAFVARLRARMEQALAQSEGAWLPEIVDAGDPEDALAALPAESVRILLDADGPLLGPAFVAGSPPQHGACIALGPEGGLEPDEAARCEAFGFRRARLPGNILRFETAGLVGVAFTRALVDAAHPPTAGHS